MKKNNMLEKLNDIEESFIEESLNIDSAEKLKGEIMKEKNNNKKVWWQILLVPIICFCIAVVGIMYFKPSNKVNILENKSNNNTKENTVEPSKYLSNDVIENMRNVKKLEGLLLTRDSSGKNIVANSEYRLFYIDMLFHKDNKAKQKDYIFYVDYKTYKEKYTNVFGSNYNLDDDLKNSSFNTCKSDNALNSGNYVCWGPTGMEGPLPELTIETENYDYKKEIYTINGTYVIKADVVIEEGTFEIIYTIDDGINHLKSIILNKNQNINISEDTAKKLASSFNYIDILKHYNDNYINANELSDSDKFKIAIRYIMEENLYTTSTFDNSNYKYATNTQKEVKKSSIDEVINMLYGNLKITYPDKFMYLLEDYTLQGDIYIGKLIIGGMEAKEEYQYFYESYVVNNNELIINNIVGLYSPGEGFYKDEKKQSLVCDSSCYMDIFNNPSAYKSKLNTIQYVFEINDDNYKIKEIKII